MVFCILSHECAILKRYYKNIMKDRENKREERKRWDIVWF